MASSLSTSTASDTKPTIRKYPPSSALAGTNVGSPSSPHTPLLGRSISSQFGSPSAFRSEQDDCIVYELGARHFSAGFGGESRPRCVIHFDPESGRRVGDYRACDPDYRRKRRRVTKEENCGAEYELYRCDLRTVDLGLVEDKLERALRKAHVEFLQVDQKPRKAVLVVPSLLPTPLMESALKVMFNYVSQMPSIMILTTPLLACVGAGVRNGLVVDIGWEETVVTAVGEYKEVFQRRSVRAGKRLTWEMAQLLEEELENQQTPSVANSEQNEKGAIIDFEYAEDVLQRMGWCRARAQSSTENREYGGVVKLPMPDSNAQQHFHIPFTRLSLPAETALFTTSLDKISDDHDIPLATLAYRVLLALPLDLRALCTSRILITGGVSHLPGLKPRLLQEISHLISTRGWDAVNSYGSASKRILRERSANIKKQPPALTKAMSESEIPLSPAKKPIQESIPHAERIHDDKFDPITQKVDREIAKGKPSVTDAAGGDGGAGVRGMKTLGAWAGASLVASLRVKGALEVEREEFLKGGGVFAGGEDVLI